jgi:hypothetical protein
LFISKGPTSIGDGAFFSSNNDIKNHATLS